MSNKSVSAGAPTASAFAASEQRIAAIAERIDRFPMQAVTLLRLMQRIQRGMQTHYNAVLKPHGLNYATYSALMMLYGSPGESMRVSDLAAATGEKPTNVTRICDELVRRRLILRKPDTRDRRVINLRLSTPGRRLIEALMPDIGTLLETRFSLPSTRQRTTLEQLLRTQLDLLEDRAA